MPISKAWPLIFGATLLTCAALRAADDAQDPPPEVAPDVEVWAAKALSSSPELVALRAALLAAGRREGPAAALPDPMVGAMLQDASFPDYTIGKEAMSMVGVEVSQRLPRREKRQAQQTLAQAETAMLAAELFAAEARTRFAVRSLYAELYALDKEAQTLVAAEELLDLLAATASARYAAGEGEQEAILKTQLEQSRLTQRRFDIASLRAAALAELERFVPGTSFVGKVPALPLRAETSLPRDITRAPELRLAESGILLAQRRLEVARLSIKADFVPSLGLSSRGSLGPVLNLRFGVELPLWKKQKQEGLIAAAEAELERARAELQAARASATAEKQRLEAEEKLARQSLNLLREALMPQTSAAFDAARASYLTGRGSFSTATENFLLWIETRIELARRDAALYKAIAGLDRLDPAADPAKHADAEGAQP